MLWVASLTPLSVEGMIVAASATLLAELAGWPAGWGAAVGAAGGGERREPGANVAVAEPDLTGRVIAAWPSFALTASWELLTRQVRRSAPAGDSQAWLAKRTARRCAVDALAKQARVIPSGDPSPVNDRHDDIRQ